MKTLQNVFHVIKDPVHGTMQFTSLEDAWIKPFIDSPHFQRLRHIKQLGMTDFIFPGAVHTRFNHCLGCCYIASQIAHKVGLADEERQLVMIAGLLHDIGHGPFSHTFEDLFHNKSIRHEDWTPYFLNDYGDEFFMSYNRANPRYHLTREKFHSIAAIIMHQSKVKSVAADIVSSQLDADRLDYLLRDNHFCGVRYGEFDFRWMLHCLAIVSSPEGERLGITHKGIGVVEHYLMARRLMTRNIYQSQKKLAFEFFLVQWLAILAKSIEEYPSFKNIKSTRLGKFLIAANRFNQEVQASKEIEKHKLEFLQQNYANYKELCDYDIFALIKQLSSLCSSHPAVELAARLAHRKMPKVVRLDGMDLRVIEDEINQFKAKHKDILEWQLAVIKTPHQAYSEEDPILVINEQGQVLPISKYSLLVNAIEGRKEHIAFLSIDLMIAKEKRIEELVKHLRLITSSA